MRATCAARRSPASLSPEPSQFPIQPGRAHAELNHHIVPIKRGVGGQTGTSFVRLFSLSLYWPGKTGTPGRSCSAISRVPTAEPAFIRCWQRFCEKPIVPVRKHPSDLSGAMTTVLLGQNCGSRRRTAVGGAHLIPASYTEAVAANFACTTRWSLSASCHNRRADSSFQPLVGRARGSAADARGGRAPFCESAADGDGAIIAPPSAFQFPLKCC